MNKKILTFFITSICLLFWACTSFALVTQYQEAVNAYKRKDYETAYQLILPLAKKGFSKAQYSLGVMYEKGKGVNKDSEKAKKWFQFAANQGLAKAQKKINLKHKDNPKALAGNHINLNTVSLKNGLDALSNKNYAIAHKFFLELAEQGDVEAQFNLGLMYGKGKGVKKDYSKAIQWWGLAAEQGNGKAQTNLGWMYEIGKGVPKDENKAAHWYQIASSKGISKAQEKLNSLLNKTKKNLQENTASSSDNLSQLNTKSLTNSRYAVDAPRYTPNAFTETGDDTNDSDLLHTAKNSLDNREFATAHKLFLDLADKGIAEAQINLGMMFEAGQGVLQDYDEAIRRYQLASDLGLIEAQEKLNLLSSKMAEAQINLGLGVRFESGQGVPQDYTEAIRRYRLAADLGLIEAQEKLDLLSKKTQEYLPENPASVNELKSPKEAKGLKPTSTSFSSKPNQVDPEKATEIEPTNKPSTKTKQEELESISDKVSELNSDSESFDHDTIKLDSYNSEVHTEANYSVDFIGIPVEPSPQKSIDSPAVFSKQFYETIEKDTSQNNSSITSPNDLVLKFLEKWVSSWEKKDADLYISFYLKSFEGLEETHADWIISRKAALKRHKNISIQIKNIQVFLVKDTAEINFTQSFESDSYSDIGTKKLVWVKSGSDWRIIKEIWVPQKDST